MLTYKVRLHLCRISTYQKRIRSVQPYFAEPSVYAELLLLTPNKDKTGVGVAKLKLFSFPDGQHVFTLAPIACIPTKEEWATDQSRIVPPLVQYAAVSGWISQKRHCLDAHRDMATGSRLTVPLTVIDCTTRSLVELQRDEPYVTLSYVWGSAKSGQTTKVAEKDDCILLPSQLPLTIEDSITACKGLNFRYLWVDRYCIQGSHGMRAQQIKQMDEIYSGSALTIVACTGVDSTHGLPGVSRPRVPDPSIDIEHLGRLRAVPAMYDIEGSAWATRGWTYQEALLSHRQLYFTEKQLFLGSHNEIETEALIHGGDAVLEAVSDGSTSTHSLGMSSVYGCIEEYSRRQLTYEHDTLNALLGVLSHFQQSREVLHIWGVPLQGSNSTPVGGSVYTTELAFEESLCWSAEYQRCRRGFPTWSWTSKDGPVRWPIMFPLSAAHSSFKSEMRPRFEIELRSGRLCSLAEYRLRYNELDNYGEAILCKDRPSRFVHVEAFVSPIVHIEDFVIFDKVVLRATTGERLSLEVSGNERLAPSPPDSVVAVHLVSDSHAHVRTKYGLIVRDMGEHWERVGLIEDVEGLLERVVKVRRKLRMG